MLREPNEYGRGRCAVLAALALVWIGLAARPAAAADGPAKLQGSVHDVPADAAFYVAMLRNREQIEAIAHSKAWASLTALPATQMLRQMMESELNKPGADWAKFKSFYDRPEVRDALALLADMMSDEVFVYGDQRWVGLAHLYGKMFGYGNMMASAFRSGAFNQAQPPQSEKLARQAMLQALKEHLDQIEVPGLVIGFRVSKKELAETQLKRLEKFLGDLLARERPEFKDRLKRQKLAGGDFLTFTATGGELHLGDATKDLGDNPDDAAVVRKKLEGLHFTFALGLRGDYVLLVLGGSTDPVTHLGQGQRLSDRPELKPLQRFADQRLTSITYASKPVRAAFGLTPKDIDNWVQLGQDSLAQSKLPADLQARINKDLVDLGKDVKGFVPEPGAYVSFAFLNGRGFEAYEYDWTLHPGLDGSKALTLLNHLGGSPLIATVGRSTSLPRAYAFLVKWAKVGNGYFEDYAVAQMGPAERAKYEQFAKEFYPLVRRFDQATSKMLLPALADGQTAFVLDAKTTSKQWVKMLPPTEKALPLLEPAFVFGVSDPDKLQQAFGEYRAIVNKIIDHAREAQPTVPNFQIPPPEVRKVKAGELFYYPLPAEWGLDEQLLPNAGLAPRVAVLSLSQGHSERLLTRTPLKLEGPLGDTRRPLASATYMDWPGLVDAVSPWIDLSVRMGAAQQLQAAGQDVDSVLKQVRTVFDVLKVFRRYTSVSYLEDGALVTHSETVIEDR